jgi:ribosomal protein S18 acetylase RimI-like enzyme
MKKEISIATIEDVDELIRLLNILFSQDIEFEPNREKQSAGLRMIISNSEIGEILVLRIDGRIVGMVSLLYSVSTALGGKVAILEDMIIDNGFRNRRLGTELLNEAIGYSKENGCLRITLLTDYNNEPAIHFYKGFGFIKSQMIPMRLVF